MLELIVVQDKFYFAEPFQFSNCLKSFTYIFLKTLLRMYGRIILCENGLTDEIVEKFASEITAFINLYLMYIVHRLNKKDLIFSNNIFFTNTGSSIIQYVHLFVLQISLEGNVFYVDRQLIFLESFYQ